MWVRGLKLTMECYKLIKMTSHPMWVRGLKHNDTAFAYQFYLVAPHVGAWIETEPDNQGNETVMSHPMWVRGLKPQKEEGNK